MKKSLLILALSGLALFGARAEETTDTVKKLSLEEIVVVGTRWQQSTNKLPSKVTVINPAEMMFQNPQTAADLLGISGKVYIQKSQQGGGSPMIRGFATNRLLYTVDGIRMNSAIFRAGNIQNVISLDPLATERTEILFGPGSVLYGSDAIGGVMNFQTLTPQFSTSVNPLTKANFVARYSSANNEKTGHIDVNVGWKKWALLTSISSFDYDDLRQGRFGPEEFLKKYDVIRQGTIASDKITESDVVITNPNPLIQTPSAYSQMNLMQKIRFAPSAAWDFQYAFHYSETSAYSRYDRHTRLKKGLPRYAEWSYGPQIWAMNSLTATHKTENALYNEATIRLAQQYFEESRIDRDINKTERRTQTEKVDAYSANLDLTKNVNEKNTLYYGFEYVINKVESLGEKKDIATGASGIYSSRYPHADWSSTAVYINDQHQISEMLTLQTGLRYNTYGIKANFANAGFTLPFDTLAKSNQGSFSGSLGVVFRPMQSTIIRLNLARGFRAPNVDDMGKIFDSVDKSVTVPNTGLKAEYANNIELGIAQKIGNTLQFDLTAYYTYLQNAMVRRDFQLNGQDSILYKGTMSKVLAIQNAAFAKVYGIQFGIQANMGNGFMLSSDLNYQKGTEEMDNGTSSASRHAAPFFGNVALSYNHQKLSLRLYTLFQAERKHEDLAVEEQSKTEIYAVDADGQTYSPAWQTINFKSNYNLTEKITLSAGVENITDRRYRLYSSGISAPGRNFVASVKFSL